MESPEGRIENLGFYEHYGGLYAIFYEVKRLETVRSPDLIVWAEFFEPRQNAI